MDLTRVKADSNSTNNYLLRGDYIFLEFFQHYTFNPSFTLVLLDPLTQKASRGIESTIKPSLKLSRLFYDSVNISLNYEYSKKFSKDETNFAYSKHVATFNLTYSF